MDAKLIFLHAYSPLHAGTGQAVDVIDLPIAREKATGIPFLPGSSLKGVLRERCADVETQNYVFGPPTGAADEYAGAVHFTDLRLLLLPVRSLAGTFAWVTSPLLLRRLLRDAEGALPAPPAQIPTPAKEACAVTDGACALDLTVGAKTQVVLEDLLLDKTTSADVTAWGTWLGERVFAGEGEWQELLTARLCIVHDDVLGFLLQTATEVTARIQLEPDSKTVKTGALWYEEALPAETILSGLVVSAMTRADKPDVFKTVADLTAELLQVGGHATVGRGLCRAHLASGGSHAKS